MIEISKAHTTMKYTEKGSFETLEECSVCLRPLGVGSEILRDKVSRKIICKDCVNEVKRIA